MNTKHFHTAAPRKRGSALVLAIGLLAVFFLLAIGYVRNASIAIDAADLGVREARAREIAKAGIYAAIGDLRKGVLNGRVNDALGTATFTFPTYAAIKESGAAPTLQQLADRKAEAVVSLSDESGKVNLNHAPASVLQAVLGVDGATARAITSSLPSAGATGGHWLAAPEDLLSLRLLTPEQFAKLDRGLLTTYTVTNHEHPEGHVNVNKAAPEVWAAMFGVSLDTAQKAYVKRPFASLNGLLEALGKLPVPPVTTDPNAPVAAPAPVEAPVPIAVTLSVGFESRCFRLVSDALYANTATGRDDLRARAHVEAVVMFDANGNYSFVYWSEDQPEAAKPA